MLLGAATIQNKRHPIKFPWAALADGLSLLVLCGYVGVTFWADDPFFDDEGKPTNLNDYMDRSNKLANRAFVEFFSAPILAIWFRALSESDKSWSYKLLTLKPLLVVGNWSLCIYMSQFMVWGTVNYFLGWLWPPGLFGIFDPEDQFTNYDPSSPRGVSLRGNAKPNLPEWTRHFMVLVLVLVSGVMYNLIEEPSRKYLNKRVDEAWRNTREKKRLGYLLGRVASKEAEQDQVCGKCGSACTSALNFCTKCGATFASSVQHQDADDESTEDHYPVCGICSTVSPFPNAKHCCKCGAKHITSTNFMTNIPAE
jgi:hypothetical protein